MFSFRNLGTKRNTCQFYHLTIYAYFSPELPKFSILHSSSVQLSESLNSIL
jgi:hypothetical protein